MSSEQPFSLETMIEPMILIPDNKFNIESQVGGP